MSLDLQAISSLYRFFRDVRQKPNVARQWVSVFDNIRVLPTQSSDVQHTTIKTVGYALIDIKKNLSDDTLILMPYGGLDPELKSIFQQRIDWVRDIITLSSETLNPLIKKIVQVVQKSFSQSSSGTIESILIEEANRQKACMQADIQRQKKIKQASALCESFAGFYEMVMKRPLLQSCPDSQYKFLPQFEVPLTCLMKSFSQKPSDGVTASEGTFALGSLAKSVQLHTNELDSLYSEEAAVTLFFKQMYVLADENAIAHFYTELKDALIAQYEHQCGTITTGIGFAELRAFIDDKARAINDTIPLSQKGDTRRVAEMTANAFAVQAIHGQGVLLSGQMGSGSSGSTSAAQWFGSGDVTTSIRPLRIFLKEDLQHVPVGIANEFIGLTATLSHRYLEQGSLIMDQYCFDPQSGKIEKFPILDKDRQAIVTINTVIAYKLRESMNSDPEEKNMLISEFFKEAFLAGLTKDVFSSQQIIAICGAFEIPEKDRLEIQEAITASSLRRQAGPQASSQSAMVAPDLE